MTDIVTLGDIVDRDAIATAQSQVNAMVTEEQWTALLAENNSLKDSITRFEQYLRDGNTTLARLRNDIAMIADRILEEANDRGWCSEYDDIVEELNSRMSEEHLLKRIEEQTYVVSFTITVTARSDECSDLVYRYAELMRQTRSGGSGIGEVTLDQVDCID